MHELLLFASVPGHQHHDLLQQLAGLTAMQPSHCLERRLVFKAHRKPGHVNLRIGGSQDIQASEMQRLTKMLNAGTFYTQVVGPITKNDFGSPPGIGEDIIMTGTNERRVEDPNQGNWYSSENQQWRLEFRDIPEAGTRSAVTARLMATASLPRGDVLPFMTAWGYSFVTEYIVEGDVFIYNDIVLFLHRVLNFPSDNRDFQTPRASLPPLQHMPPLDQSGSYVLQAAITIQDGSNPELMKMASQRLLSLREQLKWAVKLEQADRLSLDTRAK